MMKTAMIIICGSTIQPLKCHVHDNDDDHVHDNDDDHVHDNDDSLKSRIEDYTASVYNGWREERRAENLFV
ncbi:hypothetical protein AALP_AA6G181200 [Arabis alpina]|uniref:Uncharacterized protein n=1 Tax=Arabis alpina TaxID=50452 RepID=A0A087GPZ9_ARAAL|nr:hypothetical protein AALP_AA6G181200 [Arabis alpina]